MREHETRAEYVSRCTKVGKLLYYLGCLKLVPDGASDHKRRYKEYVRRLHPVSCVFFIVGFIIGGVNQETIDSFKKDTVWW